MALSICFYGYTENYYRNKIKLYIYSCKLYFASNKYFHYLTIKKKKFINYILLRTPGTIIINKLIKNILSVQCRLNVKFIILQPIFIFCQIIVDFCHFYWFSVT